MASTRNLPRYLFALLAAGMLAVVASGCGTSTAEPDTGSFQDRGRQIFTQKCGTCHKLAQAATSGEQGPDLDAAFAAAREAGMNDETIKGVVIRQVQHPGPSYAGFPNTSMPADIVTGNDLEDVAAYVAKYAGVPGAKPPKAPGEGPGAQVFANNGCGACHTLAAAEAGGTYGPNLDEVIPNMSRAKIHEAIVDPNAEKPQGYENAVMPDRFDSIPENELNQLIQFLITSAAQDNAPGGA